MDQPYRTPKERLKSLGFEENISDICEGCNPTTEDNIPDDYKPATRENIFEGYNPATEENIAE
jgi:hypothetical protein